MNKQDQNVINNVTSNLSKSMRTEGTSGNPRKFTLMEIAERVASAFIVSPNSELESIVYEVVTEELRKLGRIKKEKTDYNLAQTILSYRVLSNIDENGLIASLVKNGKYSIELTQDEHKAFVEFVNPPSEDHKQYTLTKGESGKSCSFSPNYGEIKTK